MARGDNPITKTEKSKKKRELILKAAAKVFREKGYAQTTLSDIAALADTYSGSMYYYFPSKDHLVEEVLNIGTTSVSDVVMKRLSKVKKDGDAIGRIRLALETHLYQMLKRDDFIVAYWKIIDQVPAEIHKRHSKLPRSYGKFWQDLIVEGQKSGQLRSDLDPNIVRLLLVGSSIYTLMWFHDEGPLSVEDVAGVLIEMFFNGMRPEAAALAFGKSDAVPTLAAKATPKRKASQTVKAVVKPLISPEAGAKEKPTRAKAKKPARALV